MMELYCQVCGEPDGMDEVCSCRRGGWTGGNINRSEEKFYWKLDIQSHGYLTVGSNSIYFVYLPERDEWSLFNKTSSGTFKGRFTEKEFYEFVKRFEITLPFVKEEIGDY